MKKRKTVLITGGTGGIGIEVAKICKEMGWNVAITGQVNSSRLESAVKQNICDIGFEWDSLNQGEIKKIVSNVVAKYGSIDALVNSIGIVESTPFSQISIDNVYNEFNVNTIGPIFAIQAAVPYMEKQKSVGKIVNVSSLRGETKLASQRSILYSMSKASLHSLTSSLAKLYAPKILVNGIAPGFTLTTMANQWSESTWNAAKNETLLRRPAQPQEIAEHIYFMISEKLTYMTGQTTLVDGGYSVNR